MKCKESVGNSYITTRNHSLAYSLLVLTQGFLNIMIFFSWSNWLIEKIDLGMQCISIKCAIQIGKFLSIQLWKQVLINVFCLLIVTINQSATEGPIRPTTRKLRVTEAWLNEILEIIGLWNIFYTSSRVETASFSFYLCLRIFVPNLGL